MCGQVAAGTAREMWGNSYAREEAVRFGLGDGLRRGSAFGARTQRRRRILRSEMAIVMTSQAPPNAARAKQMNATAG
jgi:hypothetical protein